MKTAPLKNSFFCFAFNKAETYGFMRACSHTFSTAYTFRIIGILHGVYIHFARLGTKAAVYTFMRINVHTHKADLLKECIKRTERTDIFAKRAVNDGAGQKADDQHRKLPLKQHAKRGAQAFIQDHKRHARLQCSRGTQIFTEKRFADTEFCAENERQRKHEHDQHNIFKVS